MKIISKFKQFKTNESVFDDIPESIEYDITTFEGAKNYMLQYMPIIIDQYVEKLSEIFVSDDEEDNKREFWFGIVEPGWCPNILKNIDYDLSDGTDNTLNTLRDIDSNCLEQALNILGKPVDTIY